MEVSEVNKLIKQHAQMAKMMKKFANPSGMAKMMKSLSGLQNSLVAAVAWVHCSAGTTKINVLSKKGAYSAFLLSVFSFISGLNKTTFAYPNFQKNQADSKTFEIK